jgi:hypothetical protein
LRALAGIDRPAARRRAVEAILACPVGRLARAAATVLRDGVPSADEARALAEVAACAPPAGRFRALGLLRPLRWLHLALLLEWYEAPEDESLRRRLHAEIGTWTATSGRITRPPEPSVRARIERLLPLLDAQTRRSIEFVLRTSA